MSNPTSNFGWQMPTNSDLVTDLPADFEVFGQAVDTSLADLKGGTTGQVLSKATNTDMDFTWIDNQVGDITAITAGTGLSGGGTSGDVTLSLSTPVAATNGGTGASTFTTGDILYSSATNTLSKLGIGSSGQVLTVSGGVPAWATAAAGGGKVLQVVSSTSTSQTVISSQTYTDSGLSASITPSSSSSKVLVIVSQSIYTSRSAANASTFAQIVRGSTAIFTCAPSTYVGVGSASSTDVAEMASFVYLDSPATTSSTTYKTQGRCEYSTSSPSMRFQFAGAASSITLLEIGA